MKEGQSRAKTWCPVQRQIIMPRNKHLLYQEILFDVTMPLLDIGEKNLLLIQSGRRKSNQVV